VKTKPRIVAIIALAAAAAASAAWGTAIPKNIDPGRAPAVFKANCSSCHDWAASYDTIVATVVVPGKPEESPAWQMISQDAMPPTGPLGAEDRAIILAWIEAGAPQPAPAGASPAVTDPTASASAQARPSAGFLGFSDKEAFHRFSGWASGGILLAAGIVGAVHAYDMMSTAHAYRDSFPEGSLNDGSSPICVNEIAAVWGSSTEQTLRWTHVGLLATGSSFYVANALTGASFMGKLPPGWSKARIHRYAFFTHAALMVSEAVMGYLSSEALRRGDHETFASLLEAHAVVGIAIPVVILGAGTIMDPRVKF
jgi:hypothetical protein